MAQTNLLVLVKKCLIPTAECFWKDPRDMKDCKVKTRSCTKYEPVVSVQDYDNYFKQKQWINQWILGVNLQDNVSYCWLLFFFIALFIENNGNILTDGTNERKYLQRKYNDL